MGDVFVDKIIERYYGLELAWYDLTKHMFRFFPAHHVFERTYDALANSHKKPLRDEKKNMKIFIKGHSRKIIDSRIRPLVKNFLVPA